VIALAERAGIRDGTHILDAGCGVAGPAIVIASHFPRATVDGVTVSREQVVHSQRRIADAGLEERVRVHQASYQRLPFADATFDQVVFFESTGYSDDAEQMCAEAFRVLKPGGELYVKDVLCRSGPLSEDERAEMLAFDRLWGCVKSRTMVELLNAIEQSGFEVAHHGELEEMGTARLLGSMFRFDPSEGLLTSELGAEFHLPGLRPPIVFGEIKGHKPHQG